MSEQKILTFFLGDEIYGLPILKTKEIIGMLNIVKVPNTPEFIKGIINIRGKIIPVMDLRLRFGMPAKPYDERTCIVIIAVTIGGKNTLLGLIVDMVSEVTTFPADDIEPPPEYGADIGDNMISGMGKLKEKVVIILDIDKVVICDEIAKIIAEA